MCIPLCSEISCNTCPWDNSKYPYSLNFCPQQQSCLVFSQFVYCVLACVWLYLWVDLTWLAKHMLIFVLVLVVYCVCVCVCVHIIACVRKMRECICDVWVWCVYSLTSRLLQSIFNKNRAEKRSLFAVYHSSIYMCTYMCVQCYWFMYVYLLLLSMCMYMYDYVYYSWMSLLSFIIMCTRTHTQTHTMFSYAEAC